MSLFVLGAAVGAYAAWGLTVLYFDHRRDEEGDGGSWVPDFVPDDLLETSA